MARQLFKNNFSSRFAASCSDSATTISISAGDGSNLPALSNGDYILLTLYKLSGVIENSIEIVKVTAIAGDVLTIERAQESTTAQSYNENDYIECRLTASSLERLQDYVNLINVPLTFTPSSHDHNSLYLPLTGGTLSNSLIFSNSRLKYGNSLTVSGLVIDPTKWYRVMSVVNNHCPWVDLYIQIPMGHSVYRVRLAKGTSGNGMGWTAEVDCGGIYNYAYGNIIAVRVVDMGANEATYVDVKFNGNATRDIRLSIVSELANTGNNYASLIACTDQGAADAGVVSHLGIYDSATTIGVSKSWLSPWGKISTQNSSIYTSHRYQVGTVDFTQGAYNGGGFVSTRSDHPIEVYTNNVKRMAFSSATANTITIYGNSSSNNITLTFAKVGTSSTYSQSIKFQFASIRHYVTDSLIPNAINNGLAIGYDDGDSISNALMIGNNQVSVNGPEIVSGYNFQVNGSARTTGTHLAQYYTFNGYGADSGAAATDYGIYQAAGAWTSPYPDLCISYRTGIRIGAASSYGGTRFYGNSFANGGGSEPYLLGVGDGANDVYIPTSVRFGSRTGQHINLYSTAYGIGIQGSTLYFRSNTYFSFHVGGTHSDTTGDPGAGGALTATLSAGGLYLGNSASNAHWYRTYGNTGWYNETYGGGMYMSDTTWVRTYNSKGLAGYYLNGTTLAGTGNRAVYSDSVGTLTNAASDESLKKDITPLTYGLSEVLALNPVFYRWKDSEKMGSQTEIGLIAQQVSGICPEVIGTNFDGTLSLDYPKLIAVLINAIKELKEEINGLPRAKRSRKKVA